MKQRGALLPLLTATAWLWSAAAAAAPAESAAAPTTEDPVLGDYLQKLQAAGMLDNREATLEEVEALLQHAQERYVQGDDLGSAVLLYQLTQSPRYVNFAEMPQMASAHYHLGVALQSYGAAMTAQAAYARVLARGPDESYFTPALRRHVDLALASKDPARGLRELDRDLKRPDGTPTRLSGVDLDEREYLEARARQQEGDLESALRLYQAVGPRSRFHTAAQYLRGVIHARRGEFRNAESAFCEVIGGPHHNESVYYVDRRYFQVRDLAHLGLGRVAHEERRHGHAFYHYFSVPEDSAHLPEAMFEAAWTMAEEGEYAVARGLIEDLRERFPNAPQTEEARVLEALLELYDCDFRRAEKDFERFIDDMAPVLDHIEDIRSDPDKVRALHHELTELRRGGERHSGDLQAHRLLLSMMNEDPTYARLSRHADALRRESDFAAALDSELARLAAALQGRDTAVARSSEGDALDAIAEAAQLERAAAGLERQIREAEAAGADAASIDDAKTELAGIRKDVRALKGDAGRLLLASPPIGSAPTRDLVAAIEQDRQRVRRLQARALATATEADDEAARVAALRLGSLRKRIDDLMGEARMGRIDAVLGAKKKLEIEVRDMAAGKFPPELFGKLQIEGMVGDDEEFWPYEGEYWADEYEGYR